MSKISAISCVCSTGEIAIFSTHEMKIFLGFAEKENPFYLSVWHFKGEDFHHKSSTTGANFHKFKLYIFSLADLPQTCKPSLAQGLEIIYIYLASHEFSEYIFFLL